MIQAVKDYFMKKILYTFLILAIGTFVLAEPPVDLVQEQTAQPQTEIQQQTPEPEYTRVIKKDTIYYYDKYGRMIAHDKTIKNQTFFYDKTGQLVGRSIKRDEKTYYYSRINKFLGYCDENGCVDKEFTSTGKIPPLPEIKHFVPVYDNNIMNPPPKTTSEEEEE